MSNFSFSIGNHRYEVVEKALNWADAAANARALGGHLASITSEAENSAVFGAVAAHLKGAAVPPSYDGGNSAYLWLGATDQAKEGDWHWQDGSVVDYANWGFGPWGQEPDNYTDPALAPDGQNGAGLALEAWPKDTGGLGSAGQWNDLSQGGTLWSVVEFDTPTFTAKGGDGNDLLKANPKGHNKIDGGAGLDTVQVQYLHDSYTVTQDALGVHLRGNDSDIDLSNVERLQFSDGAMAFDIKGNGGQAYRLYQAAFDREPDATGLGFWMSILDKGISLNDVAQSFVTSPEFIANNGGDLTAEDFIITLYNNVLHRAPDAGGLDFWKGIMAGGHSQAEVLASFSESPENQAQVAVVIGQGFEYTPYQ